MSKIEEALTFDDVLLVPEKSNILPTEVDTKTRLTSTIQLGIPLISSAMDTVTESPLAIAMAQAGGIGIIHKNLTINEQSNEVRKVKKFESGMVINPITIGPEASLSDAIHLKETRGFSGIPVIENSTQKLVGILTNRDIRFAEKLDTPVRELMTTHTTSQPLITVKKDIGSDDARRLLHKHRIERLLVVDDDFRCVGLITVKDMEKERQHPNSCKDNKGQLRVGAATGAGDLGLERAKALIESGVDLIVVDTAHGHSNDVIRTVNRIKGVSNYVEVVGGNIATPQAAEALIGAGADCVKVGIGPGTICTTRMIAGVGVPQLSAIMEVSQICAKKDIPIIADGGIKYSGDIAKAIAAGADSVMIGSLFAGTDESPGDVFLYQGRSYKSYRGMGSLGAMARGSADRYFQAEITDQLKMVPEGVEGRVPYKGPISTILHQLIGGLRSAMGYTGCKNIKALQSETKFRRISGAGLRESHVHDITITREAPNYGESIK